MITSISLENFKSFRNLADLPICPLTILCGANSSGKSTIIKSLLTFKQSYENSSAFSSLILNGKYTNNGFFEDVAFRGDSNTFSVSSSFFISNPFNAKGKVKIKTKHVQLYKALRRIYLANKEYPSAFTIKTKTTFDSGEQSILGNIPTLWKYELCIEMILGDTCITTTVSLTRLGKAGKEYALKWTNIPDVNHKYVNGEVKQCIAYFYNLQLSNVYIFADNLPQQGLISDILPNVYTLCKLAAEQYQSISFLGPLREAPARAYMYTSEISSIGIAGEYTPFVLAQNCNRKITSHFPQQEDGRLELIPKATTLLDATQVWLRHMNMDPLNINQHSEVVQLKIGDSNIADVGFGVSQVLPIIVEGLSILPEQTLILEQPEIHLHPSMQMGLTDFLISLMMQGKQIIVETHSDHIINRLVRRIMEDESASLLEKVAIYYLEKDNFESQVSPIKIDRVHGIAQCPLDFFAQYSSEVDMIVRTGFENIRKGQMGHGPC